MNYNIYLSPTAQEDLQYFKSTGQISIINKIKKIIIELQEHPYSGTGKPERLKYDLSGMCSRRINSEHRIVYQVIDEKSVVNILSVKGHYEK